PSSIRRPVVRSAWCGQPAVHTRGGQLVCPRRPSCPQALPSGSSPPRCPPNRQSGIASDPPADSEDALIEDDEGLRAHHRRLQPAGELPRRGRPLRHLRQDREEGGRATAGGRTWSRRARALRRNTDAVTSVIAQRVKDSDGRITAKRLLPVARAAGYQGSARNFRRAVAAAKADWRRTRRSYRPWVPNPGQHLVIDWADAAGGLQMFCAVLAWSRYRFVRFASDESRPTTLALLAECFEELGAVPAVVLSDRMGCLKNGIVANLVVPHPDYLR